ncbi:MAG: type II toxin-antitoxin system RelE/ParE family toxin [Chloroflexi bacterium]|nr:type II toxin-antitoxin system RelE/ParE family toxin [Chloroflexota bacterium]
MAYRVEIHRAAQKQLLSLPAETRVRIVQAIDRLTKAPRPSGCKKLRGTELWRVRTGRYRVVYAIDDGEKLITAVKVVLRREDT